MVKSLYYLVVLLCPFLLIGQSSTTPIAEIDGDMRVEGRLLLGHHPDSTSIHLGVNAGIKMLPATTNRNTILGHEAGNRDFLPILGNPLGTDNTLIGSEAGNQVSYGQGNTLIGAEAGFSLSTGSYNTAIGYQAGYNTNGDSSVFIGYHAGKDANKQNQVLYINNTSGDNPLIFGDFKRKMVGINYNGNNLNDALHVEGESGEDAFRVRIGGVTRFRVHDNGGVSLGANHRPSDPNSLMITNLQGSTSGRVTVDATGRLKRKDGSEWCNMNTKNFRRNNWESTHISPIILSFSNVYVEYPIFAPIPIKDQVVLRRLKIEYQMELGDPNTGRFRLYLRKHRIRDSDVVTELQILLDTNTSTDQTTEYIDLSLSIDNSEYTYDLLVDFKKPALNCLGCWNNLWIYDLSIAYEY